MNDVDRTFEVLKKLTFNQTYHRIFQAANEDYSKFLLINPNSWLPELARPYHEMCIKCGWTVNEFNKTLHNDNK